MSMSRPNLYETDAYWRLEAEGRDLLRSFAGRHSGWFWFEGRWGHDNVTRDFMPEDPTVIIKGCTDLLSKCGVAIRGCGLSLYGTKRATISFGDSTPLAVEGGTPRHAALLLLIEVIFYLNGKRTPTLKLLSNSDSEPQLKRD